MIVDSTMKTVLAATLFAIGFPTLFLFWKLPATKLSASEKELISFTNQPLAMSPLRPQTVFSGLDSPVKLIQHKQPPAAGTGSRIFPPGPIPDAHPARVASEPGRHNSFDSHPVVSMIYFEGSVKTAIINGQVLHEGSFLAGGQIIKIEKTRVLLRTSGKDIWLSID